MKKLYFAASIRGGREDKQIYLELINHISKKAKVLTEHIGKASLTSFGEQNTTDEYIFQRDVNWIKESDLIIAEVTNPSLGVGYELKLAEELNKKTLCLFNETKGNRLSAMINGDKYFEIKNYKDLTQAKKQIDDFLNNS
jgi:2'-deoxynucleoside 5'-phosphate N-hydrolase